ncbi:MAG: hypothetical protein ABWY78_21465 [Microvirga sp.]
MTISRGSTMLAKPGGTLAVMLLSTLAACQQAAPPPPPAGIRTVTPTTFRMPEGSGCAGEVDRFRAVMDNDLQMGHVAASVHGRAKKDIDGAASACASGRDAQAVAMIEAARGRYGYR